jgi:hypothetical protein
VTENIAVVLLQELSLGNVPNTMRWPPWSSKSSGHDQPDSRRLAPREDSPDTIDWKSYIEPQNLIPTVLLTATTLVFIHVYRNYLRRIPQVDNIQPGFFRKRSLFGRVTSVGDGDNFRLFHTPGGRLTGWGWFPGRGVPEKREDLKSRTVYIPQRLAPDMGPFDCYSFTGSDD